MNNHSDETNYSYGIIDLQMQISQAHAGKKWVEKKKFELINKLVHDLFKYKGKRECVSTISNLIVSTLISTDIEGPIDIFNAEDDLADNSNEKCKSILMSELIKYSNDLPN